MSPSDYALWKDNGSVPLPDYRPRAPVAIALLMDLEDDPGLRRLFAVPGAKRPIGEGNLDQRSDGALHA